jgi:NADPH:quinone reductase-like Zn-dependent oxidoreductase
MRAIVLRHYGDPRTSLTLEDVPTPALEPGQVRVKIAAAPIHPADIAFVEGNYGFRRPVPTVPGLEGTGTVIEANAGLYGRWLMGKRVACFGSQDSHGSWAESMVCSAFACVPLKRETSVEFGATLGVNPLTALSQLGMVRNGGHKAFIQTAAGSALGRMISRLAARQGVPAIHVVRRGDAAASLRATGEANVLSSDDPAFDADLKELSHRLGASIAFDAVGGEMSERLAAAMPRGGKVVVYGGLSGKSPRLSLPDLIFAGKSMEGFWLPLQIAKIGRLRLLQMTGQVQRLGEAMLGTKILAKLPLEAIAEAVEMQPRGSEGKVLLVP